MATLSRSEALGKREVEEHVYDVNTDEDSDDSNSFSSTAFVFPHLHASSYHEHLNVSSSSNSNDPNLLVEAHQGTESCLRGHSRSASCVLTTVAVR